MPLLLTPPKGSAGTATCIKQLFTVTPPEDVLSNILSTNSSSLLKIYSARGLGWLCICEIASSMSV